MAEVRATLDAPGGSESGYLHDTQEILRGLKLLRDQRADLTIRIDDQPETYTCKLLDTDSKVFFIEDISPRNGMSVVRSAKRFSIAARSEGLYVFIEDCRVTDTGEERGIPYFHVPLPTRMLMHQRRRAARHRLPLKVTADGARITLSYDDPNYHPLVGRLIDISAGGCRAEFDLPVQMPIESEMVIPSCTITLNRRMEIHAEAVVRHYHHNKHSQTLVCGLELVQMPVTDRRRLEHFIQTISK